MLFRSRPAGSQADPHDAIVAQLRDLAPRIAHDPSENKETSPSTETSQPIDESLLQVAPSNDNADAHVNTMPRARSHRGIFKVLLAICAGIAATTAWHSYGEEAKQRLSRLMPLPQILMETFASPQGANLTEAQDTAAQAAMPQPTAEAEPAQDAATVAPQPLTPSTDPVTAPTQPPPAQAALPAETAQSLEAMANDIAALKQAVEELKASQQQLHREIATAAEREAHPKPVQHRATPVPPRRQRTSPQAAVPHSPSVPPPPATERRIHPQGPIQHDAYIPAQPPGSARLPPQPGDNSAPRPPMPLQ
ncbi:conserved hypothetical protein [Nitrobacter hamburgensis X14]|uniref:Uncharacterized protein n=1 Tax=Nitrobacter hamburgensis (strain DSM 10229 / NCIMB 13809 / X14) TaxID=323097 RepID=Q1QPG1_NITHX|nr:conserved hypothetical protein [Nitrobacter hamburgensis X14]